jgi:hypothetical protein
LIILFIIFTIWLITVFYADNKGLALAYWTIGVLIAVIVSAL